MGERLDLGKGQPEAIQQIDQSGVVYERGIVTSIKWQAGTNAGGLLLSDPIRVPIGLRESIANSKLGQAIQGL